MKGRSVARCLEPFNVIYCYITILIHPKALISLVGESILCTTVSPGMVSPMKKLVVIIFFSLMISEVAYSASPMCILYGVQCSDAEYKERQRKQEVDNLRRENDRLRQEVENERMQREWCKGNPRGVGC
ncbi:MAG: hypothetical protein ISQ92_06015 [Pelagibacteraceae bacterium]|nr:hypothetical protein [Pelagibacteraceae bacterium]